MGGVNFMTTVAVGPEWKTVFVPFDQLVPQGQGLETTGWNSHDGRWVGITCRTFPGVPTCGGIGKLSIFLQRRPRSFPAVARSRKQSNSRRVKHLDRVFAPITNLAQALVRGTSGRRLR
jgi:hypothetical protein